MPLLLLAVVVCGCNKDGEIVEPQGPVIVLDSATGVYAVKVGRELTIAPAYKYVEGARYAWRSGGVLLASTPELVYTWTTTGDVYITLRVETDYGYDEEELKVEVLELTPPTITLAIPDEGIKMLCDTEYTFEPEVQHQDVEGFAAAWSIDNNLLSRGLNYTLRATNPGTFSLKLTVVNADGSAERTIPVEVVETLPYEVSFPTPSLLQISTDRYTFAGRAVALRPQLRYFRNPQFRWSVNGEAVSDAAEELYCFTPQQAGTYTVSVAVTEAGETTPVLASVRVICVEQRESELRRPATAASAARWNKVYEYIPAPGQYINEPVIFTSDVTTPEGAAAWAEARLERELFVSLGSFGGYIVVGFDHSIPNSGGGYDFAIQGNAFESTSGNSNEPGIVWVMQDVNGNGLPDDEWYELRGSETGAAGTRQHYEVTYYRPAARMHTPWTAADGTKGAVDYLPAQHAQPFYYPQWVTATSYMLRGTRLDAKHHQDPTTGFWDNKPYGWGYADNGGEDLLNRNDSDGAGQTNGFKIGNAMLPDGTPVTLEYIDFIKVQCGVLAQSGWLGEISTEVCSFEDLSINKP